MSAVNEILLDDARIVLLRKVAGVRGHHKLEEAFAAWLLLEQIPELEIRIAAQLASAHAGAERTYQDVAILGFASATIGLEADQRASLHRGLEWLTGREPLLYGSPMPFCRDAAALLGIIFGAKFVGDETVIRTAVDWIKKFIAQSYKMLPNWERCILVAIQREINTSTNLQLPLGSDCADIRVVLRAKGLLSEEIGFSREANDELLALKQIKTEQHSSLSPIQASLRLTALDWIRRSESTFTPNRITVPQVAEILRHISSSLRKWTWEDKPITHDFLISFYIRKRVGSRISNIA